MTQKDKIWWEQMRAKGPASFIFREGILRYGINVASILMFWQVLFILLFTRESIALSALALAWLVSVIFFGTLIGFVLWKQFEKNYQRWK